MRRSLVAASLFMLGCAGGSGGGFDPKTVGSIDGETIRLDDIDAEYRAALEDSENEWKHQRLELQWIALEDLLDTRLLESAAAEAGIPVDDYVSQEVEKRAVIPSEDDLKKFYDMNAERIGASYEEVADALRNRIADQARQDARGELLAELRKTQNIDVDLPVPEFPRMKVEGEGPAKGPPGAGVTLVAFSDFECPYCARAREELDAIVDRHPKDVRLVFRDFPLAQHKLARPAAEAAYCADKQGKFWAYHDGLFEKYNDLSEEYFLALAAKLNLDEEAFKKCQRSPSAKARVQFNLDAGREARVKGTPTVYMNGVRLLGVPPPPVMDALIKAELGK